MNARQTNSGTSAFTLYLGLGLAATLIAIVAMVIDHTGSNSIASHSAKIYEPHGVEANPTVLWSMLYIVLGLAAITFIILILGNMRQRGWTRWLCSGAAVVFGFSLAYLSVASEYDAAILPGVWRTVCGLLGLYWLVVLVVAWLPGKTGVKQ